MQIITELTSVLLMLIRVGILMRIIYCAIRIAISPDDTAKWQGRIKNAILALILSESVHALKNILINYFG